VLSPAIKDTLLSSKNVTGWQMDSNSQAVTLLRRFLPQLLLGKQITWEGNAWWEGHAVNQGWPTCSRRRKYLWPSVIQIISVLEYNRH
jgi:hypothetical protein